MKKLFLFCSSLLIAGAAVAQNRATDVTSGSFEPKPAFTDFLAAQRTTGLGDTILRGNTTSQDTPDFYYYDRVSPIDTGFLTGHNAYGDRAFAERYDINGPGGNDSSVRVIGVATYLFGRAAANSTRTLKLKSYRQGPFVKVAAPFNNSYYNGRPTTAIDSLTLNLANLRETAPASNGRIDTFGIWRFANPTTIINDSFFVGVDLGAYTWGSLAGDTVSVITTQIGERNSPIYYMRGTDSIRNIQNAVQFNTGGWFDHYYQNATVRQHFYIYAVIRVEAPAGILENGVTNDGLTFYGSFPNPARTTSTVRFALKNSADVRVDMMDMTGRTIRTVNNPRMAAGQHDVAISTAGLAAGEYIMSIRTSDGGALGVQVTVAQ